MKDQECNCNTPDRKFNIAVTLVTQSGFIDVVENCKGFMFTNLGDTIADVNGMVVFPSVTPATILGDSRSIGADKNDIYAGNIKVLFRVPLGATPLLEIVQIFYPNAK